ncbi:YqjD family protein [Pseudorhodoferax sp. Leaf267]|uniref:DUF883 family protein n=1 Tax=Pseudorhodoferax sp. Leaf267 TaxID=1736316 RepID=UPI0006FE8076|nr:DUF883 family protein [Pseudorhodoferax sp. Leaf267]KQP22995.1 hypothetical protein ASF43_03660 [Pseudorhodoferax sp. Leaf267]
MHNGTTSTLEGIAQDGTLQRGVRQVGDTLHDTIDKVAEPVQSAVNRVSNTAHESVNKVANSVRSAASRVDEQARRVRDTVRELPHQAADHARDYVRIRPLQAIGAAFVMGWLIGRLGAYR